MMLSKDVPPTLSKWPFLVGDALLLGLAWWIIGQSPNPFAPLPLLLVVVCVAGGAWIALIPFLSEYRGRLKLAESESLRTVVGQINDLRSVGREVAGATAQWQDVHEKAGQAAAAAGQIAQRMEAEAKAFAEFIDKANDSEKAHLRLEVEKLRRSERDWIQALTTLLDHVFALRAAALRSGKANLIEQLTQFQQACHEAARRVGVVPFDIDPGTPYDPERHMVTESETDASPGAAVQVTLASGYNYQGRILRKPLVQLAPPETEAPPAQPREADLFHPEPSLSPVPGSSPEKKPT